MSHGDISIHTIQIYDLDNDKRRRLIRKLYKLFLFDEPDFHFFFEPDLIIRTRRWKDCSAYLGRHGYDWQVYKYPQPAKKELFGESRRWHHIQPELEQLYHLQSNFILSHNGRATKKFMANRMHHCYLNMLGYEHYDEARYYLWQAYSYMPHKLSKWLLGFVYKVLSY